MNGLNPGPHFTLSQSIFYQALSFKSKEFGTDCSKAGTLWQRPLRPPALPTAMSLCFIRVSEQQSAIAAHHCRARCLSDRGLGFWGVLPPLLSVTLTPDNICFIHKGLSDSTLPLYRHSTKKKELSSPRQVCSHITELERLPQTEANQCDC